MANVRENADFPLTVLTLSGNCGKKCQKSGFRYSCAYVMSHTQFLPVRFYVLATSKVIITGFAPLNCCQINPDSLVLLLNVNQYLKKGKKINWGNPQNRADISFRNMFLVQGRFIWNSFKSSELAWSTSLMRTSARHVVRAQYRGNVEAVSHLTCLDAGNPQLMT